MKTNYQNPGTSEIRSTHISGLQEAIGKVEDILDLKTFAETGIAMSEVFISANDRYRIYQASANKRNWTASPTPVVKKNGVTISTGFEIDYAGGALIFNPRLISTDTVTVDATYTQNVSKAKNYFWIEEKTVNAGGNSFVLTNTYDPTYMTLEIFDKEYGQRWFSTIHYTVSGQTVTLTESALLETLNFVIKAI